MLFISLQSGAKYGDEYLANIDFIEAAETHKDGYESEVVEPEPEQTKRTAGRSKANGKNYMFYYVGSLSQFIKYTLYLQAKSLKVKQRGRVKSVTRNRSWGKAQKIQVIIYEVDINYETYSVIVY